MWSVDITAHSQSFLISSIDFCSMYKQIKRTNCDCYESERHIQAIKGMFYLHSMHPKRICIDSSVLYLLFTLSLSRRRFGKYLFKQRCERATEIIIRRIDMIIPWTNRLFPIINECSLPQHSALFAAVHKSKLAMVCARNAFRIPEYIE